MSRESGLGRFRPPALREPIENRIPLLANLFDGPHVPEAIGDALGDPTVNVESFGEMARVKGVGQAIGHEPYKILSGLKRVRFMDLKKLLILDLEIVLPPTPAATVPRVTQLLDIDERHVQGQSRMGKGSCEVDQFVKQVQKLAPLRTQSVSFDSSTLLR